MKVNHFILSSSIFFIIVIIVVSTIFVFSSKTGHQPENVSSQLSTSISFVPSAVAQPTIVVRSDIPSIQLISFDTTQIMQSLTQLKFFQPQAIYLHTDNSTVLVPVTISSLSIHLTDKVQPYGQAVYPTPDSHGNLMVYEGYGESYDRTTQQETLYIFISSTVLSQADAEKIADNYWAMTLQALWDQTHRHVVSTPLPSPSTFHLSANSRQIFRSQAAKSAYVLTKL